MAGRLPAVRERGPDLLRALERAIAGALRVRGDRLLSKDTGHWVSFRSRSVNRVFAELRSHTADVEIFLLPPPEALDTNDIATAAPPTQGWGWFRSKFRVKSGAELRAAQVLLLRSYEARRQMSRRPRRSSTRRRETP